MDGTAARLLMFTSIGSVALKEEFEYGLHLMVDGLRIRHGRLQVDA